MKPTKRMIDAALWAEGSKEDSRTRVEAMVAAAVADLHEAPFTLSFEESVAAAYASDGRANGASVRLLASALGRAIRTLGVAQAPAARDPLSEADEMTVHSCEIPEGRHGQHADEVHALCSIIRKHFPRAEPKRETVEGVLAEMRDPWHWNTGDCSLRSYADRIQKALEVTR